MDDDGRRNWYYLLSNHFDSIGIACNCNIEFGEICFVMLGWGIEPYPDYHHALNE